ncbi:MAG TPA: Gfo/Idh/MocA family oxidoreductase [Gemmataceae bacterium]|nr:Gfo/Idh/MocA family oxidoreductase [Gemmataceae bacterium]
MNIAFYGIGARAQPYLQVLERRPDVHISAVSDPNRLAAEQAAAALGARPFADCGTMLEEAHPDALFICVPAFLQGDLVLKAALAGVPLFIEPPGGPDYAQAVLDGQLLAGANLVNAVGFGLRSMDLAQEAREYLGANKVSLALGRWLCPQEGTDLSVERMLWNDVCNMVDLVRFFCGDVERVRALPAARQAATGSMVIELEFRTGTVGVLACTCFPRPERCVELELMGDSWTLSFVDNFSALRVAERDKTTILRRLNDPYAEQVAGFLAAVAAKAPATVVVDYAEALQSLAVCHAAALSARQGRIVSPNEICAPASRPPI